MDHTGDVGYRIQDAWNTRGQGTGYAMQKLSWDYKKQFLRWVEYFLYYILGIYIIEHRTFFTLQIIIIQINV